MKFSLENYTDEQVNAVLESADLCAAIELWTHKDWHTYSAIRDVLLSLLRAGYGELVERRHVQFMYFITSHLYPRCKQLSGRRLFEADLPEMDDRQTEAWNRASSDEVWSVPL